MTINLTGAFARLITLAVTAIVGVGTVVTHDAPIISSTITPSTSTTTTTEPTTTTSTTTTTTVPAAVPFFSPPAAPAATTTTSTTSTTEPASTTSTTVATTTTTAPTTTTTSVTTTTRPPTTTTVAPTTTTTTVSPASTTSTLYWAKWGLGIYPADENYTQPPETIYLQAADGQYQFYLAPDVSGSDPADPIPSGYWNFAATDPFGIAVSMSSPANPGAASCQGLQNGQPCQMSFSASLAGVVIISAYWVSTDPNYAVTMTPEFVYVSTPVGS
jgi:hypothetical protein